jgi:hypothetical protein
MSFLQPGHNSSNPQPLAHAFGFKPPRASDLGKRKFGRLKCSMAHCTLGEILDLSAGGMRVRTRTRPTAGQAIETVLLTQHGALPVRCTVRWVKRVRFFWFEAGLMFSELDANSRRVIGEFARIAADGETVRTQVREWIDQGRQAG